MRFAHMIASCRAESRLFLDDYRQGRVKYDDSSPSGSGFLTTYTNMYADTVERYLIGRILAEGPKVFTPTAEQLSQLELMDLNLTVQDVELPFPTCVVEFPNGYTLGKYTQDPVNSEMHAPGFVMLGKESRALLTSVLFTSFESIKTVLAAHDTTIEEQLAGYGVDTQYEGSLECSEQEWLIAKSSLRAAVSYMLLIDEVGMKRLPDTPHRAKMLRAPRPETRAAARQEPVYYELSQSVVITTSAPREPSEPTGRTVRPHNRRGHYRIQRFGPGREGKKRIRIKPVMVNAARFLGDPPNTEYKGRVRNE